MLLNNIKKVIKKDREDSTLKSLCDVEEALFPLELLGSQINYQAWFVAYFHSYLHVVVGLITLELTFDISCAMRRRMSL